MCFTRVDALKKLLEVTELERLNKVGVEVLEYKKELMNTKHSSIVQRALVNATTNLLSSEVITMDIHDALRDSDTTVQEVKTLVLEEHNLVKTEEELKVEFESIREPFHEALMRREAIQDASYAKLSSESQVKEDEIQVVLSFEMTKDFMGDYFEKDGDYLDRMMKSDGFAEKFAILRYGALMMKYLKRFETYDDDRKRAALEHNVEVGATKVYVNKDESLYGVELVFHIPVVSLEESDDLTPLLNMLAEHIKDANEFINIRTIA